MHGCGSLGALTTVSRPAVIVFSFRYLDLFWNYLSLYNTIMKARRLPQQQRLGC